METENVLVTPATSGTAIRTVDAGRAVEWLIGGFRMVFKAPGFWIVAGLIIMVATWILGMFPLIGSALSTAAAIVGAGALTLAARALEQGGDPAAAAQKAAQSSPLWILGALSAALTFVMAMTMLVLGLSSAGAYMFTSGGFGPMLAISALITIAMAVVITMAFWLAPALVALQGVNPVEAIRLSVLASLKNLVPFIVFFILSMIACMATVITLGLALIVVIPALIAASYIAHNEIFAAK